MVTPRMLYEPDLTNRPSPVLFGTQRAKTPTWIPPNAGTHETQKEWPHLSASHDPRVQNGPHLAVPLAVERTGGKHAPDRRRQCLVRHRAERPAPLRHRRRRGGQVAIHTRTGEPPYTADRGHAVRFAGDRRDDAAHGLRLRRAKGRPASSRATFSFSRSRSISAAPSLAFSRSLSSSSPVAARLVRAASPA